MRYYFIRLVFIKLFVLQSFVCFGGHKPTFLGLLFHEDRDLLFELVNKVCMEGVDAPESQVANIPSCEQLYASFIVPFNEGLRSMALPSEGFHDWENHRCSVLSSDLDSSIGLWTVYLTAFYEYMDSLNFSSSSSLLSLGTSKSDVFEKFLIEMKPQAEPLAPRVRNALDQGPYFWNPFNILKEDLYENYRKQKCAWLAALIDDTLCYEDLYALTYELIISNTHLRCLERLVGAFPVLAFVCDASRRTLLHWAALSGNAMAVSFLIHAGADYCFHDDAGHRPLDYAELQNNWQASQFLRVLTEFRCKP